MSNNNNDTNENTLSTGNYYVNILQKRFLEQSALIFNKDKPFGPAEAAFTSAFAAFLTFAFFKRFRTGFAFGLGVYIGYNLDYYQVKAIQIAKRYKLSEN
jgi:hypothetical protein